MTIGASSLSILIGVRDADGLRLPGPPLAPVTGAIRPVDDLCQPVRWRGPHGGRGPGGVGLWSGHAGGV